MRRFVQQRLLQAQGSASAHAGPAGESGVPAAGATLPH
jgi:hypothetical protein